MEEKMTKDELTTMLIRQFDSMCRIKAALPEGVDNPVLEAELSVLEVQLNAMGIPTDTLKRT